MNKFFRPPKIVADWAIGVIAIAVVHRSSPRHAYAIFWSILDAVYPLFAALYKPCPQQQSDRWRTLILQRALCVMTRHRPGFDLKLCVLGGDELDRAIGAGAPLILFTAHFGLTLAAPRALADRGHQVALIADRSSGWDGWHWGLHKPLQVLSSGTDVMLRARTVLEAGIPVICYVDYGLPASDSGMRLIGISPNAFRLAHRLGATVLFLASRLECDGTITIEFYRPRQNKLQTSHAAKLCAAEFASFVTDRTGWPSVVQRPKLADQGGGKQHLTLATI